MAMEDILEGLQNFDVDQLNDLNNVGSWPMTVKVIMLVVAFAGALTIGYFLHVTNLQQELKAVQGVQGELRTDYEKKYFQAVHLEEYQAQQKEMQESFDTILRQLPSDTEIPGLIEDITLVGLKNGLTFSSIELQAEELHEFYIEKPIKIVVTGSYHDLGSFVSDVADLSRIVTLHNFTIAPERTRADSGDSRGGMLRMSILAKIYRYNDERS
jgi:type IV pilus assembly protein PilO